MEIQDVMVFCLVWLKCNTCEVPFLAQQVMNLTGIHEDTVSISGLLSELKIQRCLSCGIGHPFGSDPALLWLCCRPAAVAPIRPLAWEPPCADVALRRQKTKRKKKKKKWFEREKFVGTLWLSGWKAF